MQSTTPPKPKARLPLGLENDDNRCYLNSVVQVLAQIKPLRDILRGK